ncbi:MAG: HlyD family efflux transporter periplasmic adaptor subunit [Puniceicoccales bacterium]|nr:HlyD family efflux transporter periplasmic adaptor subunit [Puniceicoccales bacterium]
MLPRSRVVRLASPTDQGVPIVSRLLVEEGDTVELGAVVAVLAAEKPAALLVAHAEKKLEIARVELALTRATVAADACENEVRVVDAKSAVAAVEVTLASARINAARRRLPDGAVREIESAFAVQTAALARLRVDRLAFIAKIDAAVETAKAQAREAGGGSDGRIAAAALAEALAAHETALREIDAREAVVAGELDVLRAKIDAARALNAQFECDPAEIAMLERQVSLAKEAVLAREKAAIAARHLGTARIAAAEAAVAGAVAEVAIAAERLALTRIKSPLCGTVLRVFARVGEAVGGVGVMEIADISRMAVEAEVSVADISRVKNGDGAEIRVPGLAKIVTGKVVRVGRRAVAGALADENPAAFKDLRVIPVEIAVDSAAALGHHTGAQVQVRIGK